MSRPRGGIIGVNATPAAGAPNSAASGVWTLREAEANRRAGTWPRTADVPGPISPSDPNYLSVSTFLRFNGTNGSTTFVDETGNVSWTAAGNAQISTSSPYEGTGSLALDGTGDWLNATNNNVAVGSGDFTIEMWVYLNSANNTFQGLFSTHNDDTGLDKFFLYINNQNKLSLSAYEGTYPGASASSFPQQLWTHVAITRISGTLRLFMGGQVVGAEVTNTQNFSRNIATIGRVYTELSSSTVAGKIDLFRITKGVGRYSASFTPEAYSYP